MIYCGIVIMVYNVVQYVRFAGSLRSTGDWDRERRIFNIPVILLVLFLAGYIAVALFGKPDIIVSAILFGGSIFVAVMQYLISRIANRIRENERLEARANAAEEANRAKTLFLSNMSHDIRTPLNAIIGYTTLAENAPADELPGYIQKIRNAGQQMLNLVNEVLEMSRIESGKLELEAEDTDLEVLFRKSEDLIRTQMEEKEISFTAECDIRDRWVICDGHRLSRVLMNILSNAYKFTDRGGAVSMSLKQTGSTSETGEYELRIRDNGIGMSPEFVEKIFIPFERERTSTVSRTQGTGLGMPISKNIIDQMGGSIEVKTKQGEGSEFTVRLTLPITDEPEEGISPKKELPDFTGCCLLLAEDNEINAEIATEILKNEGFAVESCANGQEAVELVKSMEPGYYQAVLMDIQMPVMDGYEAARMIRALEDPVRRNVPIIAMTANAFKKDRDAAEAAGMQAHIAKPLDKDVMLRTIAGVLQEAEGI